MDLSQWSEVGTGCYLSIPAPRSGGSDAFIIEPFSSNGGPRSGSGPSNAPIRTVPPLIAHPSNTKHALYKVSI